MQVAKNTFTNGMVCDIAPETTGNTSLTYAKNATILTYNGNEFCLLNDIGNVKTEGELKYNPVGSIEEGGIIYIASCDNSGNCQIGSFPSPDYGEKIQEPKEITDLTNSDFDELIENNSTHILELTDNLQYGDEIQSIERVTEIPDYIHHSFKLLKEDGKLINAKLDEKLKTGSNENDSPLWIYDKKFTSKLVEFYKFKLLNNFYTTITKNENNIIITPHISKNLNDNSSSSGSLQWSYLINDEDEQIVENITNSVNIENSNLPNNITVTSYPIFVKSNNQEIKILGLKYITSYNVKSQEGFYFNTYKYDTEKIIFTINSQTDVIKSINIYAYKQTSYDINLTDYYEIYTNTNISNNTISLEIKYTENFNDSELYLLKFVINESDELYVLKFPSNLITKEDVPNYSELNIILNHSEPEEINLEGNISLYGITSILNSKLSAELEYDVFQKIKNYTDSNINITNNLILNFSKKSTIKIKLNNIEDYEKLLLCNGEGELKFNINSKNYTIPVNFYQNIYDCEFSLNDYTINENFQLYEQVNEILPKCISNFISIKSDIIHDSWKDGFSDVGWENYLKENYSNGIYLYEIQNNYKIYWDGDFINYINDNKENTRKDLFLFLNLIYKKVENETAINYYKPVYINNNLELSNIEFKGKFYNFDLFSNNNKLLDSNLISQNNINFNLNSINTNNDIFEDNIKIIDISDVPESFVQLNENRVINSNLNKEWDYVVETSDYELLELTTETNFNLYSRNIVDENMSLIYLKENEILEKTCENKNYYNTTTNSHTLLPGYKGKIKILEVSLWNSNIGNDNTEIKSIKIGNNLISLNSDFINCDNLETITITLSEFSNSSYNLYLKLKYELKDIDFYINENFISNISFKNDKLINQYNIIINPNCIITNESNS